jgi:hypothetical protein
MLELQAPEPPAPPDADLRPLPPDAPWHALDAFSDRAEAMRADIDAHLGDPYGHAERHQVWDYWYVPDSYTYLRTRPERVLAETLVRAFVQRLRQFALARLGLSTVTHPYLSLYVNGCSQTQHNDAHNGAVAYVFSLTRWTERSFTGGETLIYRQQDYWRDGGFRRSGASTTFYELVPAVFNRLVLFDDRMVHAVPEVHGSMDPRQGRIVLHGHLKAGGMLLQGGAGAAALPELSRLRSTLQGLLQADGGAHSGVLTLACGVTADGRIGPPTTLLDRIFDAGGRQVAWPGLVAAAEALAGTRLPAASSSGRLTLPLVLDPR